MGQNAVRNSLVGEGPICATGYYAQRQARPLIPPRM